MNIKLTFTSLLLLFVFHGAAQQNHRGPLPGDYPYPKNELYDSVHFWVYPFTIEVWTHAETSFEFAYDANKNIASYQTRTHSNNAISKSTFIYNANNLPTSRLIQYLKGNTFVNGIRYTYVYVNTYLTEVIKQDWDSTWSNSTRTLHTYDNDNQLICSEQQKWDQNNWLPLERNSFSYNPDHLISKEIAEEWSTSAWLLSYTKYYGYDSNQDLVSEERRDKDSIVFDSTFHKYDAHLEVYRHRYNTLLGNGQLVDYDRTYFSYDSKGHFLHSYTEAYMSGLFSRLRDMTHFYNSSDQLTDIRNRFYAKNNVYVDSTHFFIHQEPGAITDLPSSKNAVIIYPNPGNGSFTITLESKRMVKTLEVYNVIGERVLQQQHSNQVTIPNAQAGIYLVKIDDGIAIYTRKITVQ